MAEEKQLKPLSERAKYRLKVAAGLLRSRGQKFNFPRDEFYPKLELFIRGMPSKDKDELRGLVDWVEEYDNASIETK